MCGCCCRRGKKGSGLASRQSSGQSVFVEASGLTMGAAALNVNTRLLTLSIDTSTPVVLLVCAEHGRNRCFLGFISVTCIGYHRDIIMMTA